MLVLFLNYICIITFLSIAAAELARLLFLSTAFTGVTGSADGLFGFNSRPDGSGFQNSNQLPAGNYGFGPFSYNEQTLWVVIFGFIVLAVCVWLLWSLMRSPWGRVIKGIREDEDAVRALGKNVFAYKMQALVIGGVFGGLGGIVYAAFSNVSPGVFVTSLTFFIWTSLLLGGAATIFGPVIGSIIFWVLQAFLANFLSELSISGILPVSTTQASTLRFVLVGIGLMLLVIYRPQGIFGDKREMTFVK